METDRKGWLFAMRNGQRQDPDGGNSPGLTPPSHKKCAELEASKEETKAQRALADRVAPLEREVRKVQNMKQALEEREVELDEFRRQQEAQQLKDLERWGFFPAEGGRGVVLAGRASVRQ